MQSQAYATGAALAIGALLTGCAAPAEPAADEQQTAGESQPSGTDTGEAAGGDAAASEGAWLDTLYADRLHDGVEPAAPGTAYIEVAGKRFEFSEVTCTIDETPGAERFHADVTGDAEGVGHVMYMERTIGEDIGWNWEDEFVQLGLLGPGDGDSGPLYSNSMAQHERAQGEAPEWDHGSGQSPLVRIVDGQATSVGELSGIPFAPDPIEGAFVAAVSCG